MSLRKLSLAVSLLPFLSACGAAQPPAPKLTVERTEEDIDLSGEWNDVDSDLVAKAMIEDCMGVPWAEEWSVANGRRPVVRLHAVKNRTDGYIDDRYFTKQLEASLLRSRRVEVVSSLEEAGDARREREDQAQHASDDTIKSQGQEAGSDFILTGSIVTQRDQAGGTEVRAYLTSLELVDVATQKKAWVGQKRIKKRIQRNE